MKNARAPSADLHSVHGRAYGRPMTDQPIDRRAAHKERHRRAILDAYPQADVIIHKDVFRPKLSR